MGAFEGGAGDEDGIGACGGGALEAQQAAKLSQGPKTTRRDPGHRDRKGGLCLQCQNNVTRYKKPRGLATLAPNFQMRATC